MTKRLIGIIAACAMAAMASTGYSEEAREVQVLRRDSVPVVTVPQQHSTGTISVREQFRREAPSRIAGAQVSFEPGARTAWHTHPNGQTLLVTSGTGFVQGWGGKPEVMREGDIVWIPPGVKHWHGAAANESMSHFAFVETQDGKTVEWAEKVTEPALDAPSIAGVTAENEVIELSKRKWAWMSERNVKELASLFHEDAAFVHMGATMTKTQELDVISSGRIHYKHAEIQEASVKFMGDTAILLNKIRLVAVVGGNEVTNPFVVTEVYVRRGGKWVLGSMSFTRLVSQVNEGKS